MFLYFVSQRILQESDEIILVDINESSFSNKSHKKNLILLWNYLKWHSIYAKAVFLIHQPCWV
jgi:hypothetical protein